MTVHFPESLPIPDEVLEIARKLEGAGHETWCVGGAVRDNLLLLENHDFDLATAATPDVVQRLFRRTVPIGVEHGTVAVLDRHGAPHEVTTFRKDVRTDGRHAVVEFGVSLDEDLARRDFTINAIAYHPIEGRWRDLFGGAADLDAGVIRAVGDAGRRFREDYLRIVRALRFAARFGFTIEPATWEAARANVEGTAYLSAERVRDEWFKGLETAGRAGDLVRLWQEVGVLEVWLPEIGEAGSGTREALDRFGGRDPVLLTSYLSSDPEATLRRLRCSNPEIERGRLIGEHRADLPDPASPREVRRWHARVGPAADDLVAIARSEGGGEALETAVAEIRLSGAPLTIGDLALNGSDLMALGMSQGPDVGRTLRALLEAALDDPSLNTREALVGLVRGGTGGRGRGRGRGRP